MKYFSCSMMKHAAAWLISAAFIFSCNSEKPEKQASEMVDSVAPAPSGQKVFYSIPSPIQATSLLKKAGAKYDKSILNNPANETKYNTSFKKAVNMGIYGADLAYSNMFNHSQEAIHYLNVVNNIGNSIGLTGLIEQEGILSRFQENLGNKDSLNMILADLFMQSEEYLKENQQYNTAGIVLAGGWLEGVYIAAMHAKKDVSPEIRKLIGEQKLSLNSLMGLLPAESTDQELVAFRNQLSDLKSSFDKVEMNAGDSKISTDQASYTTTVAGSNNMSVSDDLLKEITGKVITLRSNLIN